LIGRETENAAEGVVIDLQRRKVFIDGVKADLTGKEFCLLEYLVKHQGITISRDELKKALWNCEGGSEVFGRTIDVHVRRLRAGLVGNEDIVRTIRGEGYRFDKHPDVLIEGI
jgi:DNA-binding response OmpR family regulator